MNTTNKLKDQAAYLMPDDSYSSQVLLERANQLAKQTEEVKKKDTINFIRFRLGNNEHYGIAYQTVEEAINNVVITKLPYINACITGIMNYRGALLTIFDLSKFFNIPMDESLQKTYVIVVNVKGMLVGLLVDDLEGIDAYEKSELHNEISYHGIINSQYVFGIHQCLTTILNIETIIMDLQLLLGKK